jgi:hypothetical protein
MITAVVMVSCKKEHSATLPNPATPPVEQVKKILLKDINIPHLPSPYYHFEYGADSLVVKASFDSDLAIYDVIYKNNRLGEMRDNIIVNHDTLRYLYDNSGKLGLINFINDQGVSYRHAMFLYNGQQVKEIDWDHKVGNVGYIIDRTLTFDYFADGNLKELKEHRPDDGQGQEFTTVTQYDQYDDKINVDDFMLTHDGINDHLFLFSGFRLQKNNPGREIHTGDGVNYIINNTYNYNRDGAPLLKMGDLLWTSGPDIGTRFQASQSYSYY